MTVHNIAEYVAYHQAKLREQNTPSSQSQPKKAMNSGVNPIHSAASFKEHVIDGSATSAHHLVLVDCFATWCGPCKAIAPKIAAMSNQETYKNVAFYKLDVDELPDVAQDLQIRAMPTFLLFKDGVKVEEIVGANEVAIRRAIDKHL